MKKSEVEKELIELGCSATATRMSAECVEEVVREQLKSLAEASDEDFDGMTAETLRFAIESLADERFAEMQEEDE